MQSKTMSLVETLATFLNDNLINIFLIYLAKHWFGIEMKVALSIAIIGQSLNVVCTYMRRRVFNYYGQRKN